MLSDRVIVEHMTFTHRAKVASGAHYLRWWYTDGTMGVSGGYRTRAQAESAMERWTPHPKVAGVSCHREFDQAADPAPEPERGNRWYLLAVRRRDGLRAVRGPFRSRRALSARLAETGVDLEEWQAQPYYSHQFEQKPIDPTCVGNWQRWAL